jgi:hypothetical protein
MKELISKEELLLKKVRILDPIIFSNFQISDFQNQVNDILEKCPLNYYTMKTMTSILLNLQIQFLQVSTLKDELSEKLSKGDCKTCYKKYDRYSDLLLIFSWKVFIIEQPLPCAIMAKKFVPSPTTVSVITGTQKQDLLAATTVQCYSNVRLICYEYSDVVSHYLAPIYCCL